MKRQLPYQKYGHKSIIQMQALWHHTKTC